MTKPPNRPPKPQDARKARLAQALRANLRRRKDAPATRPAETDAGSPQDQGPSARED